MPALPAAPSVIKVALHFQLDAGHTGSSRFYMKYSGGPPSDADLDTLASGVSTVFGSDLASWMSENYHLVEVFCTDLTSGTAAEGSWTGSVAGGRSGTVLPIDACVCLNHKIARRYRGGKPKIFLPFGLQSDLNSDGDTWTSGLISGLGTAWHTFVTDVEAIGSIGCTLTDIVNVSYYSGFASVENPVTHRWRNIPTPRSGDATIDGITSTFVYPYISQQRRRRFTPA